MLKRLLSLLLTASMLCGIPVAFAEDEEITVESNGVVSTENFTEDNVIYKAMQNNKRGTSLRRVKSSKAASLSDNEETVTADFDVVLGFDMSADMYDFDYNGEMSWLENFEALSEQVPEGTRFSVVTDEVGEFVADLNTEIESNKNLTYSGESDIITLLDNCADTFDDASEDRNKVVIAATANVADEAELADKIEELQDDGVIPFVFVFDNTVEQMDNVYICETNLQFELAVSELYLSLVEFKTANNGSLLTNNEENTDEGYISDFRKGQHNFNFSTANFTDESDIDKIVKSFGMSIASILNIYGCLPTYAENDSKGYDLFEGDTDDNISVFELLNSLHTGKVHDIASFEKMETVFDFWDNMKGSLETIGVEAVAHISHSQDYNITNQYIIDTAAQETLIANLKRRFPVLLKIYNNTYIVTKYNRSEAHITMDVYDYTSDPQKQTYQLLFDILEDNWILSSSNTIMIDVNATQHEYNTMIFDMYSYINSYASAYNVTYDKDIGSNILLHVNAPMTSMEYVKGIARDQYGTITKPDFNSQNGIFEKEQADGTRFIVGVKVRYINGHPNIYNAAKLFNLKIYHDVNLEDWYYQYVMRASDKGIINGYGNGLFVPDNSKKSEDADGWMTNGEFIKIVIAAAGFDEITNADGDIWASNYIKKAQELGILPGRSADATITKDYQNKKILRWEAAYIMKKLFVDNIEEVKIPTLIYEYEQNANIEKNGLWKSKYFKDQDELQNVLDDETISETDKQIIIQDAQEAVRQMFVNSILDGVNESDGTYFYPKKQITRAEVSKIIVKCLFNLDEDLKTILVTYENVDDAGAELIEFTDSIITKAGTFNASEGKEYYFIAPKTGYYYISDIENCIIIVKDMRKRDIRGLDAYNTDSQKVDGVRYNIKKGEIAYIDVKVAAPGNFSFKITEPQDGELVFAPDRSGTFIYDNCPEYIIQDDLADAQYGNTALITAENVSGNVTVASSHLIRSKSATIHNHGGTCACQDNDNLSFDYLLTNKSNKPISVTITNIGIQTPSYEYGYNNNGTYQESACYQAWADYRNINYSVSEKFIGSDYLQSDKYLPYNAGTSAWETIMEEVKNKTITVDVGEEAWLFGDATPNINLRDAGFPIFIIFDCIISDNATIQSMVFHYKGNINTSSIAKGKIYTRESQRDYTNEPPHWIYNKDDSNLIDGYKTMAGNEIKFNEKYSPLSPPEVDSLNPPIAKGEIFEIGTKYKGTSNSLAQVFAESLWEINDDDESKFYSPTIYNRSQSFGFKVSYTDNTSNFLFRLRDGTEWNSSKLPEFKYWITHINSECKDGHPYSTAGSDMIGLEFDGIRVGNNASTSKTGIFFFDNYHSNTDNGNQEVDINSNDNAMDMVNFSVTENYHIKIKNNSQEGKKIYYMVGNESGICYEYLINGKSNNQDINIMEKNIRCKLPWGEGSQCIFYEMFSFEIGVGEEREIEFSITIPNVGIMGVYNMLYAESNI